MPPASIVRAALLVAATTLACSGGGSPPSPVKASDARAADQAADHPSHPDEAVSDVASPPVTITGVPGGCQGSPPDPTAVIPPRVIFRIDPVIPEDVQRPGVVVLAGVVNPSGQVENLTVQRTFTPAFDKACLDAIRQWRYEPATQNGRPVAVDYHVTCTFSPQRQSAPKNGP
jgi:periplasmic protein TonB